MDYTIPKAIDGSTYGNMLTITIDEDERAELRVLFDEDSDHFGTDGAMADFLEPLICNSELEWVSAEVTGDLTDAPMLCVYGHSDDDCDLGPILQRWAYMNYQVRSPLQDLLETGKVVFTA